MPYLSHKQLIPISLSQVVFRYMDFPKYVWMIQNKMLYFPSLEQLASSDPWEGCHSKLNFQDLLIYEIPLPGGDNMKWTRPELSKGALEARKNLFANCWHMNDSESDAQWRIYGGNANSLAIVSSGERLSKAIVDEREVYGTQIRYYNPSKETTPVGNIFFPATCKRSAFSHECECRLIYWKTVQDDSIECKGVSIEVNLEILIEQVVISPRAEKWFVKTVEDFTTKMGFSFCVSQSDLLNPYQDNLITQ